LVLARASSRSCGGELGATLELILLKLAPSASKTARRGRMSNAKRERCKCRALGDTVFFFDLPQAHPLCQVSLLSR
jgi:hypothetical protein